jgi:hypothetical protein
VAVEAPYEPVSVAELRAVVTQAERYRRAWEPDCPPWLYLLLIWEVNYPQHL